MLRRVALLLLASASVWSRSIDIGGCINRHDNSRTELFAEPELKLPWGTYKGTTYGANKNVTLFKNVRYGQAPVGDLRFKASKFPEAKKNDAGIQDTSSSPICIQAYAGEYKAHKPEETEDCLFLDIYVPSAALKKDADPLPVVVYLYGGAFFYGYKDTTLELGSQKFNIYDGQGPMNVSENEFIWVVGNYRVGAFGWLAGTTMEKDGTPNAGLHDQKLMVDFVNEYISEVNGNPYSISLWGNSAGAASIMHHLTAGDGQAGPRFDQSVLWSPAYQWLFDRQGTVENTFKDFAMQAGCDASLKCLQKASTATLRSANQAIVNASLATGKFPYGPALDGSYVQTLPASAFRKRRYNENLQSLIVSHVVDEAGIFLPKLSWINSEEKFKSFLNVTFPGSVLADARESIAEFYPVFGDDDKKTNQILRTRRLLQDSTFICNSRMLINDYPRGSWIMEFDFPPGLHGSDLLPAIWTKEVNTGKLIDEILGPYTNATTRRFIESRLAGFSSTYQRYFAGHAAYGNPNALIEEQDEYWPLVRTNRLGFMREALHVGLDESLKPVFTVSPDLLASNILCELWANIADTIGDGSQLTGLDYSHGAPSAGLTVQPEL